MSLPSIAKQHLQQFLLTDTDMSGYVGEDRGDRAEAKRGMSGDRDVVFRTARRDEAHMTSRLAQDFIAHF